MRASLLTRRRALVVLAAAAACPSTLRAAGVRPFEWRGTALGADARLLLWAEDQAMARAAIDACVAEIERLEQVFSLFRPASEISRLNRAGVLDAPSHDMVRLLHLSRDINRSTEGLFDPTVQPLWEFFSRWYSGRPERQTPPQEQIAQALARVGMEKVQIADGRVACHGGARITLNGIAQGYITDQVAVLLRAKGWRHVLIDLGEVRALGAKPDGAPWQVAIRESGQDMPLADAALATSSGEALAFDRSGAATHIFNPLTGRSPAAWRCVTVRHALAAVADGLSTALHCATPEQFERVAGAHDHTGVWKTRHDGTTTEITR